MNILIIGNTAGLTNDFILRTFPNQAVFIFGQTGVKNSRKNKITVYTKYYENDQLEDIFEFHDYDQIIYLSEYLNYEHESSGEIENLNRLLKCFQEKINTRSNLLVNNLAELQEEAKAEHLIFLGPKVAEDIGDRQAAYKELLKNMGYRLWVSRLTISKGENKLDITLNLENSGVAPLYGDWTVVLYLCDASGKVVQSQELDCRLSELLPKSHQFIS
ncbi:hypothetical protein Si089_01537 [Streptococcus infantarius subsp. infantarius]|uniref:DUF4832 domain-containing protein n=1 Tax=Streptococcus infantarius TaxID=102684 RepID=UPI00208E57A7|nr:hypothetical protein [Streptococcus infantarius subsp. infantarius]MCO4551902.1 hypothetical protein [Streptococcus infantarius subsp. infantarius]MCO4557002.1 hypothetical protein [Streptococcus infantarius subsp. infantarius]MCO4568955.1 hypothetical protein [Streptococcus infantarius subsp. infantarius]